MALGLLVTAYSWADLVALVVVARAQCCFMFFYGLCMVCYGFPPVLFYGVSVSAFILIHKFMCFWFSPRVYGLGVSLVFFCCCSVFVLI